MARPRIEIDISRVEELAAQGLNQEEIALCLGISERTLRNHKQIDSDLSAAIKSGKAKAASEIANRLYQMAKGGDLGAIVWWEKTRRGLTDKMQQEQSGVVRYIVEYADPAPPHTPARGATSDSSGGEAV